MTIGREPTLSVRAGADHRMHRQLLVMGAALCTAGCLRPSAVTRGARGIERKVMPAARAFASGTRRVVSYAGGAADDAALAAKVQAALIMRKGLDGGVIHVQSEENGIRLTGHVSSPGQKRLAAEVARNTVGVASVVNCLQVTRRP